MHRTSLLLIYWPRIKPDKLLRRWRCKMKPNELYICFGHSWNQDSVGLNGYFQLPKSYNLKLSAVYLLSVLHVWAMTAQHTNNGKKENYTAAHHIVGGLIPLGWERKMDRETEGVGQKGCNILVLPSTPMNPWDRQGVNETLAAMEWRGPQLSFFIYPRKPCLQSKAASNIWGLIVVPFNATLNLSQVENGSSSSPVLQSSHFSVCGVLPLSVALVLTVFSSRSSAGAHTGQFCARRACPVSCSVPAQGNAELANTRKMVTSSSLCNSWK